MSQRLLGNISRVSEQRELRLNKLKGTLVDFNAVEHLLDDEANIESWCIELRKFHNDPNELDEFILHVQAESRKPEALEQSLRDLCREKLELQPNRVDFLSAHEMRKLQGVGTDLKERRLIDHRPKPVSEEIPA